MFTRLMRWPSRAALLGLAGIGLDVVLALLRSRVRRADVVDRATGADVREKRPLADDIQIALVWDTRIGTKVLCRTPRFLQFLEDLSHQSGDKMDRPDSRSRIDAFITDNGVDVADLDRPVEAFTTLNEFFARPLRAGARPIADPDNSDVVISPADCRLLCFESIHGEGTIAVKGRQPSVSSLLGLAAGPNVLSGIGVNAARAFHDDLAEGNGFSVAVARLAPSDYHRYHWPTDATWQPDGLVEIMGSYQSVAPTAIASSVDVLGTNRRSVIVATSAAVGTFAVVVIGAVKVGSIQLTATPGAVHKGDELGLFRYGGSTVAIIFDAGRVTFDPDLLANSTRDLETTVSMGEQIGRSAP